MTSGTNYKFKYFLRNAIGDSGYSPEVTIRAATIPAKPDSPTVSYPSASTYRITFTNPSNTGGTGVAIDSYTIEIRDSDGVYQEYLGTCDGSDSTVKTNMYCEVSLAVLTGATFDLEQGDQVLARYLVTNEIGDSSYSDASDETIYVVAIPATPTVAPIRVSSSTRTNMVLDLTALTGYNTGGVSITSYLLESNGGGSGDVYSTVNDALLTQMTQTVTAGTRYKYRYAVTNSIGTSGYSPVLDTYAAELPDQVATPTTEIYSTDVSKVKITWTEPSDTGAIDISSYTIVIGDSVDVY